MSRLQFINPITGEPIVINYHKEGHLLVKEPGRKKCKLCSFNLVEIWNGLILMAALRAAIPDRFNEAVSLVPDYDKKNICFNKYINEFIDYYDDAEICLKFAAKGYVKQ